MDDEDMADSKGTTSDEVPMVFVLQMRVSGGMYERSLVHDLALALGLQDTSSPSHILDRKASCLNQTEEGNRRCILWEVFEVVLKDTGKNDADGCAKDGPVDAKVRYQLLSPHPRLSTSTVATDNRRHKRRGLVGAQSVSANEALCEVWSEPGGDAQAAPSHSWRGNGGGSIVLMAAPTGVKSTTVSGQIRSAMGSTVLYVDVRD